MNGWRDLLTRERPGDGTKPLRASPNEGAPVLRPRSAEGSRSPQGPRARRLLQPLPLVGIVLVLIALVGYWSVYRATTERTPVLVAAHDLTSGTVLDPGDLRAVELAGEADFMAGLVPDSELDAVLGSRLGVALESGLPLPRGSLEKSAPAPPALTLAVPALHAVGGTLRPGDRVTVLATFGSGTGQAEARAIARGLEVLAVGGAPEALDPNSATIPVTVAVRQSSLASALALANAEGKIDLLREGSERNADPIPPARAEGSQEGS
jgi:Flp pilus assembly protein CpaB